MPIKQIKILKGIAPILVGIRDKRITYLTNRAIKDFDLLVCLKATTTAGHIKNYPAQLKSLLAFAKISKATFYTRLWNLQTMGMLTVNNKTIHLKSWEAIAEIYGLAELQFHTINYDTDNKKQTIQYILNAIEIVENKQLQTKEAQRKLIKTPEIEEVFNTHCMAKNKTADYTLKNLHAIQRETYATGAADYDVLHSINADTNRSAQSIKRAYNHHSIRNVAYMKRQLVLRGLATVTNRVAPVCKYEQKITPTKERGKTQSIGAITALIITRGVSTTLIKKGSKHSVYTTYYNKKTHARVWRLPDNIEINTQIIRS
jgi:hypothetical protein